MHKDCIILCHETDTNGQLLCIKEINGKPFLEYLAAYFGKYHICKVIFSINADQTAFKEYILANRDRFSFAFDFSENDIFQGTGTAIINALQYSDTPDVLIMQGHRYFDINFDDLIAWQQTKMGDATLALAPRHKTNKNLLAHLDEKNQIDSFSQGADDKGGLVVSGVYCIFRPSLLNVNFPHAFSFEEDYLQKMLKERDYIGMISDEYYGDLSNKDDVQKMIKDFPTIFKEIVS